MNGEKAILTDKTERDQGISISDMSMTQVLLEMNTEQLEAVKIDTEGMVLNDLIYFMLKEDFDEFSERLKEI